MVQQNCINDFVPSNAFFHQTFRKYLEGAKITKPSIGIINMVIGNPKISGIIYAGEGCEGLPPQFTLMNMRDTSKKRQLGIKQINNHAMLSSLVAIDAHSL